MKKMILLLVTAALLSISTPASIGAQGRNGGGFQSGDQLVNQAGGGSAGSGAAPVTVAEALKMSDDAWVTLTKLGFSVDWFQDGRETGEALELAPSDAVILDLGLPGRDGWSILKDWRARGRQEPVLILTAQAGP